MDLEEAREFVVDAEKYHASAEAPPKGNTLELNNQIVNIDKIPHVDTGDDDEFFHLTCHIDGTMKNKIERGEYLELEKLLPKCNGTGTNTAEGRLEWVSKDGMTFLSPAQDKEQKITNIRKWDQAFRVYAAIYCNANPSHAGEIWQYIYVINSAVNSYQWDNVTFYDMTFRQLMAERPGRKWSKLYNQVWQLALKDPINKSGSHPSTSSANINANSNGGQKKQKN